MLLAYDGGGFRGYARQEGMRTIQGVLEEMLSKVLRAQISTSVAGRTDAGVHALGQVVSFRTEQPIDCASLASRLNSMGGPELAISEIVETSDEFDARHSAVARTYEYAIYTREVVDPFSRHTTWHLGRPLDVDAMKKAASALIGEHDFRSFGRVEEGRNPVRRIQEIEIEAEEALIVIRITANSFLQQMVRSIVGTLVKVGEGKIDPSDVDRILHAHDRSVAGPVAPPHGLFLTAVEYPEDLV